MSEVPTDTRDELEKSYESSLTRIINYASAFPEVWNDNPNLRIEIIDALIAQDESFHAYLERRNGEHVFSLQDRRESLDAKTAAKRIREIGGRFYPEHWETRASDKINEDLGIYLAKKEVERRLGKR